MGTLTAYFSIENTVSPRYININFWFFTHNDEIKSVNNYILIDDLKITIFSSGKVSDELPIYSEEIESVEDIGMLTGVNAATNTLTNFNVGGTDLGFPYYDDSREKMYFLFGDTFSSVNKLTTGWRSQTVGITSDLSASDGIAFDSFISDSKGKAISIIPSRHDDNDKKGEKTTIPTGGIVINGVHYVYYMSIREWIDGGWDINFCSVAKSTDGINFSRVSDLYWTDGTDLGKSNTISILGASTNVIDTRTGVDFLQIFPYQMGDYIYLFGLTAGRKGGVKLARVKPENIEIFDEYEYYTGKNSNKEPIWIKGIDGLTAIKNNLNSYVIAYQSGELSVSYNEYLGKYILSTYCKNKIVMFTSENLIDWSLPQTITTALEIPQLYGGFTHELYVEEKGKQMYFFVSQYQNDALGDNGYNVKILRVTFN